MFNRTKQTTPPQNLPQEWVDEVVEILNTTYAYECQKQSRYFEVYGQLYPTEFVQIASFVPRQHKLEKCYTCFLSCDAPSMATPAKLKETHTTFIDIFGMFFDEIFTNSEWDDWEPEWQEVEWEKNKFWYKITRENVEASLEADRLLKDSGLPDDES